MKHSQKEKSKIHFYFLITYGICKKKKYCLNRLFVCIIHIFGEGISRGKSCWKRVRVSRGLSGLRKRRPLYDKLHRDYIREKFVRRVTCRRVVEGQTYKRRGSFNIIFSKYRTDFLRPSKFISKD